MKGGSLPGYTPRKRSGKAANDNTNFALGQGWCDIADIWVLLVIALVAFWAAVGIVGYHVVSGFMR